MTTYVADVEFENNDMVYRYDDFDFVDLTCGRREAIEYSNAWMPMARARRIR